MSYILEALKKAERARELGRDIAPETGRAMVYGARARRTPVLVAGGLLLLLLLVAGGLTLWFLPSAPTPPPRTVPEPERRTPAVSAKLPPASAAVDPGPPGQIRPETRPPLPPPEPPAAPALPQTPVPPRPSARPGGPPGVAATPGSPATSPAAAPPIVSAPGELQRMPLAPAPGEPAIGEASDVPSRPVAQPLPTPERPRAEAAPAPPAPQTLRDAVAKMTLNVLVYGEAKASRMVTINGRQYVEGQLVEDLYLVESIRPEGALLVYQGERVLLGF